MNLKPLGDRVLVKPAPKEEKTSSGLYIASAAQEHPQRGEVLAVGAFAYFFTCKFSYFGGILWLKILILAPMLVPSLLRA